MIANNDNSALLDNCLYRFQQGDPSVDSEFQRLVWPFLRNLSRRIAPYLANDLHEEVAQQACLYLSRKSSIKFDPRRGTAKSFLPWIIYNAARRVWADNRPPGTPSRLGKKSAGSEEAPQPAISIEELDATDCQDPAHQAIIARSELDSLLALADREVAVALPRIYCDGDTLMDVAKELGMSRFKLNRKISKYFAQMQGLTAPCNSALSGRQSM